MVACPKSKLCITCKNFQTYSQYMNKKFGDGSMSPGVLPGAGTPGIRVTPSFLYFSWGKPKQTIKARLQEKSINTFFARYLPYVNEPLTIFTYAHSKLRI